MIKTSEEFRQNLLRRFDENRDGTKRLTNTQAPLDPIHTDDGITIPDFRKVLTK